MHACNKRRKIDFRSLPPPLSFLSFLFKFPFNFRSLALSPVPPQALLVVAHQLICWPEAFPISVQKLRVWSRVGYAAEGGEPLLIKAAEREVELADELACMLATVPPSFIRGGIHTAQISA